MSKNEAPRLHERKDGNSAQTRCGLEAEYVKVASSADNVTCKVCRNHRNADPARRARRDRLAARQQGGQS